MWLIMCINNFEIGNLLSILIMFHAMCLSIHPIIVNVIRYYYFIAVISRTTFIATRHRIGFNWTIFRMNISDNHFHNKSGIHTNCPSFSFFFVSEFNCLYKSFYFAIANALVWMCVKETYKNPCPSKFAPLDGPKWQIDLSLNAILLILRFEHFKKPRKRRES